MPTDRVLIELVTLANMTGINQIKTGMLGLKPGSLAFVAGLGLAVAAGKSSVEISEKHEKAQADLGQAIKATGGDLKGANAWLDTFTDTNRAYISTNSDVIEGYAKLTRSGLSQEEVQKDLNRAVDLAAVKHISLSDAVDLVINAEHGRLRGLVDLGITSGQYVDSSGNVVDANHNMQKVMEELDRKTEHGRQTLTKTEQATNRLSGDWEDMATIVGPPLLGLFDDLLRGADFLLRKLKELGQNTDFAKGVSDALGLIQENVLILLAGLNAVIADLKWLEGRREALANFLGGSRSGTSQMPIGPTRGPVRGVRAYQSGGTVPGPLGAPQLAIVHGGETVTPAGGGGVTVNIYGGMFMDHGPTLNRLANMIAQRLSYTTGR